MPYLNWDLPFVVWICSAFRSRMPNGFFSNIDIKALIHWRPENFIIFSSKDTIQYNNTNKRRKCQFPCPFPVWEIMEVLPVEIPFWSENTANFIAGFDEVIEWGPCTCDLYQTMLSQFKWIFIFWVWQSKWSICWSEEKKNGTYTRECYSTCSPGDWMLIRPRKFSNYAQVFWRQKEELYSEKKISDALHAGVVI